MIGIWFIITLVVFILFTMITLGVSINKSSEIGFGCGVGMGVGTILILFSGLVLDVVVRPTVNAYRLGQINAICGKIEYERVYLKDSTVVWERIIKETE